MNQTFESQIDDLSTYPRDESTYLDNSQTTQNAHAYNPNYNNNI
jgi:hypothetical protein